MIEWQPALEQLGGGIVGNAAPSSGSTFPSVPRDGVAGLGIVGGPAASHQVHPLGKNVTAPPLEALYVWHYTFEQVQQFQQCDAREDGYCYIAPDKKVFSAWHASQVNVVHLPMTSARNSAPDQLHSELQLRS